MHISIITINKNNASGLEKTIQSVLNQTFENFEYILIDGASNDGSVEIIEKYSTEGKIKWWISEPDTGRYEAMNKGIRKASGDYCLFLNSGDWLIEPDTLKKVSEEIAGLPEAGVYYSDRLNHNYIHDKTTYPDSLVQNIPFILYHTISHQNSLIKTSLFFEHGFYNEDLIIGSDWEFYQKEIFMHRTRFIHLRTMLAVFDKTGISSIDEYTTLKRKEQLIMYKNVFNDLAEVIINFQPYEYSIYHDIINRYGNTKTLDFILRIYRFIVRRLKKQKN